MQLGHGGTECVEGVSSWMASAVRPFLMVVRADAGEPGGRRMLGDGLRALGELEGASKAHAGCSKLADGGLLDGGGSTLDAGGELGCEAEAGQ